MAVSYTHLDVYKRQFRERTDYDAASSTGAWDELKATVSEEELAADVTFVAYGPGDANLGKGECTCHRVMLMRLVDGVAPEVIDMMRRRVLLSLIHIWKPPISGASLRLGELLWRRAVRGGQCPAKYGRARVRVQVRMRWVTNSICLLYTSRCV